MTTEKVTTALKRLAKESETIIAALTTSQNGPTTLDGIGQAEDVDDFCLRRVRYRFDQKKTPTDYTTGDGRIRLVCLVSKKHTGADFSFWFTFHARQAAFLDEHKRALLFSHAGLSSTFSRFRFGAFAA